MVRSDRIDRAAAHRRHVSGWTIALAILIGLGVVGCSDDAATTSTSTTEPRGSSTTTDTTSSTSTPESTASTTSASTPNGQTAEEEIVARYIGYWDARFAANSGTPNPDDPALRDFATGAQLDAVIAETRSNLENGLAFRPAANPSDIQRVDVIDLEGDHAVVQECVVTDGVIYRRNTGEVVDGEVYTQNIRGELQHVDGAWRVSSARLIQQWEGVAGCAHASSSRYSQRSQSWSSRRVRPEPANDRTATVARLSTLTEIRPQSPRKAGLVVAEGRAVADRAQRTPASGTW